MPRVAPCGGLRVRDGLDEHSSHTRRLLVRMTTALSLVQNGVRWRASRLETTSPPTCAMPPGTATDDCDTKPDSDDRLVGGSGPGFSPGSSRSATAEASFSKSSTDPVPAMSTKSKRYAARLSSCSASRKIAEALMP